MSAPNENFFRFGNLLVELARAGVDYAAVGGVAVSLNGFVRATDDVDILAHNSPENLRKLLDCLTCWGEGRTLDDFRPHLRHFESDGARIAYLSPADLIFLKQGSCREKDQLDVSAMKEILAREAAQS